MANIFVVEDDPASRDYLRTVLGHFGHTVTEAADGAEALSKIAHLNPDLVISDILMPTMDGYEFVRRLRQSPALAHTRVIFYSATYHHSEAAALARSCGALRVIAKPADPQELNGVVEEVLKQSVTAVSSNEEVSSGASLQRISGRLAARFTELKAVRGRLSALIELGKDLSSQTDPSRLAETFCKGARYVLGAKCAVVVTLSAEDRTPCFATSGFLPEFKPRITTQEVASMLFELVGENKNSVCCDHTSSAVRKLQALADAGPIRSLLVTRLSGTGSKLYGVFAAANKLGIEQFDAEEEDLANTVSGQFAVAYENLGRQHDLMVAEEKYRTIFENAVEGMFQALPGGVYTAANPALAKIFGFASPQELMATTTAQQQYVRRDVREAMIMRLTAIGEVAGFEYEAYRKDGSKIWVSKSVRAVPDASGSVLHYEGSVQDVTARKRMEAKVRILLDSTPDAMVIVGGNGKIAVVNNQVAKVFGYTPEELVGQESEILVPERFRANNPICRSPKASNSGSVINGLDLYARRKDGTEFPVDISTSAVETDEGVLQAAAIRDISERRLLEEQFRQAQKMEAVGRLAGGVAHDFNNLLMIISSYGQLMLDQNSLTDSAQKHIKQILGAAERAAAVTKQLLAFSRRRQPATTVLDLNVVVQDLAKMLPRLLGEDIQMSIEPASERSTVKADLTYLDQIIMNLAVNARDAMPKGGRLRIKTANIDADSPYAAAHPPLTPGKYAMISVTDNGTGMDQETKSHIFEPFFTTKEPGKGTGLGLATVYGIVQQSGGCILVESTLGAGTTFEVYLPRIAAALSKDSAGAVVSKVQARGETILLVEDEAGLRAAATEYLGLKGYTVLPASGGPEALRIAENHQDPIAVLVTDVIMPEMGGIELAKRLLQLRPALMVVYMSGYSNQELPEREDIVVLQKPFALSVLDESLRRLLAKQTAKQSAAHA
ncbi:MAG TPA: response regulator [Terriglobales bacterium]|nr:response regulator [Terriglobales bacterium]